MVPYNIRWGILGKLEKRAIQQVVCANNFFLSAATGWIADSTVPLHAIPSPYLSSRRVLLANGGKIVFVHDLLIDPTLRSSSDVSHTVVAVASSSSEERATKFIKDTGIPAAGCKAYGTYEELVADRNVDVVYVATPHSHHFQNVMLALNAGKNVLCEKAFTVNGQQARILCETAQQKHLFLMEAVWTRYFPVSRQIREIIRSGEIGEVLRVIADNSFGDDVEKAFSKEHRMVNKDLAGGALLDCK